MYRFSGVLKHVNTSHTLAFYTGKLNSSSCLSADLAPDATMSKVKDFLDPNSMLTMGIAGSITVMIANALWLNFGIPPKFLALVLCLLLGLVFLAELTAPLWQKSIYYIINGLIIFSVSGGSNVVGISTNQTTQVDRQQVYIVPDVPILSDFFINNTKAINDVSKQKKLSHKKRNSILSNQSRVVKAPAVVSLGTSPATVKLRGKVTSKSSLSKQPKEQIIFQSGI